MKLFRKKTFIIWGFCMLCCLTACTKSIEQKIVEQMELGQKYLTELDYEKAIVAFEKAIEINPKAFDAYAGLAQVYVEQIEFGKAADTLESGQIVYAELGEAEYTEYVISTYHVLRNTALHILKPLAEDAEKEENYQIAMRYYQILFLFDDTGREEIERRIKDNMEAMELKEKLKTKTACSGEELVELLKSLDSETLSKLVKGTDRFVMENETGKGIGIYHVNESYMIYAGEYRNGLRDGNGVWVGQEQDGIYPEEYLCAEGMWINDMPNGHQQQHGSRGNSIEGNVIDGIWDGDVMVVWPKTTFEATISDGYWKWIDSFWDETFKGQLYIISNRHGNGGVISENDLNRKFGIVGYGATSGTKLH